MIKKNDYASYWMEDGILIGELENKKITLKVAKDVVSFRNKSFPGNHPHLASMKIGKIEIDKEARNFFGSKEGCAGLTKIALIVNSPMMNMLGNIFISLSKPAIPTKLFTDIELAKNWLKTER